MRGLAALSLLLAAPAAAQAPSAEWVTLGTGGGPVVQLKRGQPANALVVGDAVYLFDVGEGVQARMKAAGLPLARVRAAFLTHHHLDHVGGVGPLIVNRWIERLSQPLVLVGPPGTVELVAGLVAAAAPVERAPLVLGGASTPPITPTVAARDAAVCDAPTEVFRDDRVRVSAIRVDHFHNADGSVSNAAVSLAYRVEAGGRTIVFSGDTGPSRNLTRLARGADILISEVMDRPAIAAALARMNLPAAVRDGFMRHMDLDHLTPPQVGAIAKAAGVKAVVLTHLVPGRDEENSTVGYTAGLSREFTGPVVVANDGDRF